MKKRGKNKSIFIDKIAMLTKSFRLLALAQYINDSNDFTYIHYRLLYLSISPK